MKIRRNVMLGVLVCFVLARASDLRAGFAEEHPWLAERSAWSETGGPRGWWAVGNGRVFGIVGPNLGGAAVSQITGPHIMLANVMNNGSAFGPATLSLTANGGGVPFQKRTLSKVRGTAIVVMDFESPDVAMMVLTYAPPEVNALLRTVIVKNKSAQPLKDVVLTAGINRTQVKDGRLFNSFQGAKGIAMGQTRQLFSSFLDTCEVSGPEGTNAVPGQGTLTLKIGQIEPGQEAVQTQYLVFSMLEEGGENETLAAIREGGLLKKTYDYWSEWQKKTTRLDCPDHRLVDLLDDTKILVDIQTARPQCAAGPMEFFAGVWVRDSNGPLLYHLRMGQLEVARNMLEFYYRASAQNKRIANWIPMDVDTTQPVPEDLDWSTIPNDPVEIPSWLILQHRWYYEYTGDLEPIRQHWAYLKRCLMGQLFDEKGQPFHTRNFGSRVEGPNTMYRFPPHGDETWIYPGYEVLNNPRVFPEPNDQPHWDSYCADSTFEFVAAAETMVAFANLMDDQQDAADFGKIAGDARAACERDYWNEERGMYGPAMNMRSLDLSQPPFTMINFNPLWIDYLRPDDPQAAANVLATMKYTMNSNYVTDATETLRIYVGMQPGMFLYNLAAINHPYAEPALAALVGVASPSGEYTEKHVTEPTSYKSGFLGHRIRPWEGGINADAVYYYLSGLKPNMGAKRVALCPHLPFGWKTMAVTGQRLGDGHLDIAVKDDAGHRVYTLTWQGSGPLGADFRIALPTKKIASVTVGSERVRVRPKTKWGVMTADLSVDLQPGKPTAIDVQYAAQDTELPPFQRERYQYVIPRKVPSHEVVLWENEPRKGNVQDKRTFDHLDGKVTYRLLCAYNPCSPAWIRPFLLKSNGKPNTPLFVMGPNSVGNSLKYGKFWGNPELAKLFTEYMEAGGVIAAINTGEKSSDFFGDLLGDSAFSVDPVDMAATVPVAGVGQEVCDLLGMFKGEAKPQSSRMFQYKNMVVLARPEANVSTASILAKTYGKGLYLALLTGMNNYQQTADIILALSAPGVLSKVTALVEGAAPETTPPAVEDKGKDGA